MNIITTNPVLTNTQWDEDDFDYSNASAATRRARKASRKSKRQAKGTFGERFKKGVSAVANSGILDVLGGQSSNNANMNTNFDMPLDDYVPTEDKKSKDTKKPMSKGVKIAIGVGVAALLGVGIYMLMKKKKGSAKAK